MGDKSVANPENGSIQISKIKVKPGTSIYEGKIILFYHVDSDSPKKKTKQLKAREAGVLSLILVKEGDIVQRGSEVYTYKSGCSHSTVINDLCAECGFDLQKDDKISTGASVPMVHTIPSLKVSEEQARILGRADETRLINDRKLVLLVDLDQTLIHTTNDNIDPSIKDIHHFQLSGARSPWYHTRLRPGTLQFLESISKWYELHICTFGSRNYAHQIAHFLDRQGKYFSHRILSRDECFDAHSKTGNLKALFPCGDNLVCIIDDREDVWNYASNLIHVKPYHFFRHTGDINAPPGLSKTDNDFTEGYSCAQLAEGVTIKQANTNKNKDKNDYEASAELLRKRKGNEEKIVAMNKHCEEREKDVSIEKSSPTVEISAASDITSDQSLTPPQPEVHKELKVLEEKISRTNQEIVSIVKQVKSTKDDILDEESCKSAYKPSSGTAVFISEQNTNEEYDPSTVTSTKYEPCPTIYEPSSQERTKPSLTMDEYVPSVQSEEYEPSIKGEINTCNKYVPTSTKAGLENEESTSHSSKYSTKNITKEMEEDMEYVPANTTLSEEYVPANTTFSEEYVPPVTTKVETNVTYIPTTSTEYTPSEADVLDTNISFVEYVPSQPSSESLAYPNKTDKKSKTDSEGFVSSESIDTKTPSKCILEYIPSGTKTQSELIYVPTSVSEYVPSSKPLSNEYSPTSLSYESSSTAQKDGDYVPTTKSRKYDVSSVVDNEEYEPTSCVASETNNEYVPTSSAASETNNEYVPTSSAASETNNEYVPTSSEASETNNEYVPTSSEASETNNEYVPTSSEASETNNEYDPTSVTSMGCNEYMPSTTSGTNDGGKHEYTPTPMEIEYVPTGNPASIPYVPTSITETSNDQNLDSTNSNDNSKSERDSNVQFCESSSNSIKSSHDIDAYRKGNAVSNETGYQPNRNNASEENLDSKVKGLDDMDGDSSKENKGKDKSKSTGAALVISTSEQDEMKDVEEIDDYLLYLEEILKHIHEKFYITFDQLKERGDFTLPDLKNIIPAIRNTVLQGVHLVFSGVVPSKMRLEENKAYRIASSLGAAVSDQIHPATTHLVAQKPGTAKVNEAKRRKNILIVTLDWLWMCAERWERVDERLFPVLPHTPASSRTPPAHCASPPYLSCPPSPPPPQFCDSINPLMTLTSEDIANMDKEKMRREKFEPGFVCSSPGRAEDNTRVHHVRMHHLGKGKIVEDIFNETDDDEEEEEEEEEGEMKESSNDSGKRKRADSSDSSDVDSLNGDSRRRDGEEIQETQRRKILKTKRRKKQKSKIHRDGDENSQSPDAQNKSHPLSDPSSAHTPGNNLLGSDSGRVKDNLSDRDTTSGSSNSSNDLDLSDENSDGETINSRFRRCASLPSDCEIEGKENDEDEWNLMGDMLEREFM